MAIRPTVGTGAAAVTGFGGCNSGDGSADGEGGQQDLFHIVSFGKNTQEAPIERPGITLNGGPPHFRRLAARTANMDYCSTRERWTWAPF
jgi:hypothetical protein